MSGLALPLLAGLAGSLAVSLVMTPIAMRVARRVGFVDRPGGHKSHRDPIPYGGGGAIFLSIWIPALIAVLIAQLAPIDTLAATFGEATRPYIAGLRERASQFYWLRGRGGVACLGAD
ncbi:MAG: hypothetical protein KDA32_07645 [Phycisphaerales bacterium]|nr:hypothetical protein [Phycisphaerales bacterium]